MLYILRSERKIYNTLPRVVSLFNMDSAFTDWAEGICNKLEKLCEENAIIQVCGFPWLLS